MSLLQLKTQPLPRRSAPSAGSNLRHWSRLLLNLRQPILPPILPPILRQPKWLLIRLHQLNLRKPLA